MAGMVRLDSSSERPAPPHPLPGQPGAQPQLRLGQPALTFRAHFCHLKSVKTDTGRERLGFAYAFW
jgi:hypothetical protein